METPEFYELLDVQRGIREVLEQECSDMIWVRAEIKSLKVDSRSGHCYLMLIQKEGNKVVASMNANIWRNRFSFISQYFYSRTQSELKADMSVLVRGRVTYHEQYGLSFNISDINPEYTIGASALARQQTIEALTKGGYMEMQKSLVMPRLPYRFAVISSDDAAGFGDFCRHIGENPYGFVMSFELFPSPMQGVNCAGGIIAALNAVAESGVAYDAVLIMRGGGSELDLACFDDYKMALAIAEFPVPVLTAIGHDRDYHVCDMVAHRYLKTPTALADYLIDIYSDEDALISDYARRIIAGADRKLASYSHAVDMVRTRIRNGVNSKLMSYVYEVERRESRVKNAVESKITRHENAMEAMLRRVEGAMSLKALRAESALDRIELRISQANPANLLSKGYVLVTNGKGILVKSASEVKNGENMSLRFKDGTIRTKVNDIKLN